MNFGKLGVEYNNTWPNKFSFTVEKKFIELLKNYNVEQVFQPAILNYSADYQFQIYLSHFLDSLDMLPMRPDLAFENIWKIIDKEASTIKENLNNGHTDKFELLFDKIFESGLTSGTFVEYLKIVPLQTCKYAAKRLIKANTATDSDQVSYLKKVKRILNNDLFFEKFFNKYIFSNDGNHNAGVQRNAGKLLMKIFNGVEVTIDNVQFQFTEEELSKLLVRSILVNTRNERSHGNVFPSFKSSKASLENYKNAYFLYHMAYALLLDIFLYKEGCGVLSKLSVEEIIVTNTQLFNQVFHGIE